MRVYVWESSDAIHVQLAAKIGVSDEMPVMLLRTTNAGPLRFDARLELCGRCDWRPFPLLSEHAINDFNACSTIDPLAVSATATPSAKACDGTRVSNQSEKNGAVLSDGDSVTDLLASYNHSNVPGRDRPTLSENPKRVSVSAMNGGLLSDYARRHLTTRGSMTRTLLWVWNVRFNRNGTLNTSGAIFIGLRPGDSVTIVPGLTPGTIKLEGSDGANYVLTDPYIGYNRQIPLPRQLAPP